MLLDDLFEARLPLRRGTAPRMRNSYTPFIVSMSADDFLDLTTTKDYRQQIIDRPFPHSKEEHEQAYGEHSQYNRFELPFLWVRYPSGEVCGHEGRHRAAMVLKLGGDRIPVAISMFNDIRYMLIYEEVNWKTDESYFKEEIFYDIDEARARKTHLEQLAAKATEEGDGDTFLTGFRITTTDGARLKGHPGRSDGWDKAAWRVTDFPNELIGQFDKRVCLPVSRLKVGLAKGQIYDIK